MNKAVVALGLGIMVLFSCIILISDDDHFTKAEIIYVDDSGGANYTKIQDAINASKDGDTIYVYNGTYYENVVVNKSINLMGEDKNITIIDGGGVGDVISIAYDWVNISGFTVKNSGGAVWPDYYAGIRILSCNNSIAYNTISNNYFGLRLESSNFSGINNNTIFNNSGNGIDLDSSSNNSIIDNIISLNTGAGIVLSFSSNNTIISNVIDSNDGAGIGLNFKSNRNIMSKNDISDNFLGIGISGGPIVSNVITFNHISGHQMGIDVHDLSMPSPEGGGSAYHFISNNILCDNDIGISLMTGDSGAIFGVNITSSNIYNNELGIYFGCFGGGISGTTTTNCTIEDNRIGIDTFQLFGLNYITYNNLVSSNEYAIYLNNSGNINIHHNNFFNNNKGGIQVFDNTALNLWNDAYPSGGNYWSDYKGIDVFKGIDQDIPGSDFIGDSPYIIDLDSKDKYPLISPIGNLTYLYEGWNLFSIPFIQPNTDLNNVLSLINGSYDAVQWYNISDIIDPWKHYQISKPIHLNDLKGIDHTIGFWVHITEPGGLLFEYPGIQPAENQTFTLYPGWNLVGYPSLKCYNRTAALNNITFGKEVDSIWTWDAQSKNWTEVGELDHFIIGRGYWIHATIECIWEVPL